MPGFGGGRLGGLFLSPDAAARRGDARSGFVPWHRLAELEGGADLLLDRTRFDPDDRERGAAHAATAALASGARQVLMTRWPLPSTVRLGLLGLVESARSIESPPRLAEVVAQAQRAFVGAADDAGQQELAHPRFWAAWLPFDADVPGDR